MSQQVRYRWDVSSRYLRPQVFIGHVLVLVLALTCLRLGWWQWKVFEAVRGTGQNLGYAMLWPVFAGSFIFMWLRFLQLESTRDVDADPYADDAADGTAVDSAAGTTTSDSGELSAGSGVKLDGTYDASRGVSPQAQSDTAGVVKPTPTELTSVTRHTRSGGSAREAITVGMGYISRDDDDDPELAAYNDALARLAEEDERRAR
ncbi:MAG: hypothetical protein ABI382_08090 [Nakamurella sp.]